MATLNSLKASLREKASEIGGFLPTEPLSDEQYRAGFETFTQDCGAETYREFIIPQLSQLLASLLKCRPELSVLEVGPGPTSVLESLADHQKRRIGIYTAIEPNLLFAESLEARFHSKMPPLPCLSRHPIVYVASYSADNKFSVDGKFDLILFCHSLYGMKSKRDDILAALDLLEDHGTIVVFHRDGSLQLNGLVCHRTASFPTGITCVADDDIALDNFSLFVAGSSFGDRELDEATRVEWRNLCRTMGRRDNVHQGRLHYSAPEVMFAFKKSATALGELKQIVPVVYDERPVKNRQARAHLPTAVVRPTQVEHVQACVRWAIKHDVGLTIIGGGHSDHCQLTNVVAVDMSAFNRVHILPVESRYDEKPSSASDPLVVAEAGCTTGDIIMKAMKEGLAVPLGSRPSVGAGLWLQGGIGHLARAHGLTCDAIVGAVVVRVDSGQIVCVGNVPSQYWPADAVREEREADLLWALKGAGSNFGIVVSVTFKACQAPTFWLRNWVVSISDEYRAKELLRRFYGEIAEKLTPRQSSDVYLYWERDKLHLGVTMLEHRGLGSFVNSSLSRSIEGILGPEDTILVDLNSADLFETDMYMSRMHGGHGGGKTSAFKRCVFLKDICLEKIATNLVRSVESRPWDLCYLHLLHGGEAVSNVESDATAFGCRGWTFACVITGVWPRDQDGTELARACEQWVYAVVKDLLPLSCGVYGADLGPDPRDYQLTAKAFGPNRPRLTRLKRIFDPYNVLSYTCPLPVPTQTSLAILVTGEHGAGKDYCANVWTAMLDVYDLRVRMASISDETKKGYAAATGADLNRLLWDGAYKEQHRSNLEKYFQAQLRMRPRLLEEHFLQVVRDAGGADILIITGMRDEAPVTTLSPLVPDWKLLDVRVEASPYVRQNRRGVHESNEYFGNDGGDSFTKRSADYRPSFILNNTTSGKTAAEMFAQKHLLPLFDDDIRSLKDMVSVSVPNFPRPGIDFCHILGISQQRGGLRLCTSLLESHFAGDWTEVDAIVSPETGGLIFASPLATMVDAPLVSIRAAGKLPPPTVSVNKLSSYISSTSSHTNEHKKIEMCLDVIPEGASIVVVDDVLSTGKTLCAVLELLKKAGVGLENVSVMVVAEFPIHGGRKFLRDHGFGGVRIQSLLAFSTA
ncbi:unnamed protein product [Clonostachys rosea]|uniref:FAD-binding PCMH-type domain-containing protein n=1 Tax=Bionectria ochroleuca TaxID=29856 RepID=A0ABY6V2I0_BIOOC|nr:unnamed protein product [Clonostachys rosea]